MYLKVCRILIVVLTVISVIFALNACSSGVKESDVKNEQGNIQVPENKGVDTQDPEEGKNTKKVLSEGVTLGTFAGIEEGDYVYILVEEGESKETLSFMIGGEFPYEKYEYLRNISDFTGSDITVHWELVEMDIPEAGGVIEVQLALDADLNEEIIIEAQDNDKYSVAGIDDAIGFEQFFHAVQSLIIAGDKEAVAQYVHYPINVTIEEKSKEIKDRQEFMDNYDKIMNEKVVEAVKEQKAENLFVNYKGVMVGSGEVWFGVFDTEQYYIIAVNNNINLD